MSEFRPSQPSAPLPTVHKIGGTRSIQSAVLVCEYLRNRCAMPQSQIHPEWIKYRFLEPTDRNGWWSADIVVEVYDDKYNDKIDKTLSDMVEVCRAFAAGRGEIW